MRGDLLKGTTPFDHTAGRVLFADYARKWVSERYANPRSSRAVSSSSENHLIPTLGRLQMIAVKPPTPAG